MKCMRGQPATILVGVCLAFVACTEPPDGAVPVADEVRQLLAKLDSVQNAADLDGFSALMTDDIVLMPPGGPAVTGRTAVTDFYRAMFSQGTLAIRHEPAEHFGEGSLLVHRGRAVGTFRPHGSDIASPFENKYLYVLTRATDGRLRFARVIFNSDTPPPAP